MDQPSRSPHPAPAIRRNRGIILLFASVTLLVSLRAYVDGSAGHLNRYDPGLFFDSGQVLLSDRWLDVYEEPALQTGPLQLSISGSIRQVASATTLDEELLLSLITQPLVWILLGTVVLLVVKEQRARPLALASAGFLTLVSGATWSAFVSGQTAEALIPLLWMLSAIAASRGKGGVLVGSLLGLSAALKLTGTLGIPLILLLSSGKERTRAGLTAAALAVAAYLPFWAFGTFNMGDFRWPLDLGGPLSWLSTSSTYLSWEGRLLHAGMVVALGTILVLSGTGSRAAIWTVPAGIACAKVATDPAIIWYWYWIPVQLSLVIGASTLIYKWSETQQWRQRAVLVAILGLSTGLVFVTPTRAWAVVGVGVALAAPRVLPSSGGEPVAARGRLV